MRVVLSELAEKDLLDIGNYIAQDNPARAITYVEELIQAAIALGDKPHKYRLRAEIAPKARSFAYGQYVLLYWVGDKAVMVERIVHGARDLRKLQ